VLKFRDGWVLFERDKLLPRSYNHACWDTWSSAMIVGLTILAVLTFIAIGEVRKTHANGREQQ
jgi:hypothetical protein